MKLKPLLLTLLPLVVLAACAKPESQILGSWHVDPASAAAMQKPGSTGPTPTADSMTMVFNQDKSFVMNMKGMAKAFVEGTYDLKERAVTLTATKMLGMDLSKMPGAAKTQQNLTATLAEDGKSLTLSSPGLPSTLKFVK